MKYTLIRDGEDKVLMAGTKKVATWDKHDDYDYVLSQAQAYLKEEDTLSEKVKGEKDERSSDNEEA